MRSFAVIAAAALVGSVAAAPSDYSYGPAPPAGGDSPVDTYSAPPVYETVTDTYTVTSCAGYGGCGGESPMPTPTETPYPSGGDSPEESSTPCPTGGDSPVPTETPYSPPPPPPASETPYPTGPAGGDSPVESSPCPTGTTVTVTVSEAPYPTGPAGGDSPVATGTGVYTPPAQPTYAGAATANHAGLALAGMGALAAFFL